MEKRVCKKCNEEKKFSEFVKRKDCRFGIGYTCLSCNRLTSNKKYVKNGYYETVKKYKQKNKEKIKDYQREYKQKNKEKILEYQREYGKKNKEKLLEFKKEYHKEYYKKNKEKIIINHKLYNKQKRKTNHLFSLTETIRSNIGGTLRKGGFKKSSKTEEILGCTFKVFKEYLESKFEPWMTWDNRGLYNGELDYGWDIDHIIPISMAKNEGEVIKYNHHTNLQPLCSKTNRVIKRGLY